MGERRRGRPHSGWLPSWARVVLLAVGLALASPSSARAQSLGTTVDIAAAVFGAADLAYIAYDLTMTETNRAPARSAVYIELVGMTLQLASGLSLLGLATDSTDYLTLQGTGRDVLVPVGAWMAVMAAPLLAHAIMNAPGRHGSGMHASLVATPIGDARAHAMGLALVGRF